MRWPWKNKEPFQQSHFTPSESIAVLDHQIYWSTAALIVASGCVVAATLSYLHDEALRSGEQLVQSLAHVIEEQTSRTFQSTDQRLELTASKLQALDAEGKLDVNTARVVLREQLRDLPFIRAIWTLDAAGRIAFDSDTGNIGVDLSDREYFRIYRDQPAAGFHISAPVRSRSTGQWLLSASRPLCDLAGQFTGVMVAAIEPISAVSSTSSVGNATMRSPT